MAIANQVYTLPSFVTGASVTTGMAVPGTWLYMFIEVPTMSAGYSAASTPIYIQASSDGVTYRRFTSVENTTATLVVGTNDFIIGSAVSQRFVSLNGFNFNYMRAEISGTCTTPANSPAFKVICVSNQ